jgi:hypothetical protein
MVVPQVPVGVDTATAVAAPPNRARDAAKWMAVEARRKESRVIADGTRANAGRPGE